MMTKEKISLNTSSKDVLPAVATFLGRHDLDAITGAPGVLQEMFEDLMCSTYGDDGAYRERMVNTLRLIRDFGHTVQPFSQETVWQAVNR